MESINKVLMYVNENWVQICVFLGLAIALAKNLKAFIKLSNEDKVKFAKNAIAQTLTRAVANAEYEYADWNKAGAIKRAQVIEEVFDRYPVLTKVTNQKEIVEWLDGEIDKSLAILGDTVKKIDD